MNEAGFDEGRGVLFQEPLSTRHSRVPLIFYLVPLIAIGAFPLLMWSMGHARSEYLAGLGFVAAFWGTAALVAVIQLLQRVEVSPQGWLRVRGLRGWREVDLSRLRRVWTKPEHEIQRVSVASFYHVYLQDAEGRVAVLSENAKWVDYDELFDRVAKAVEGGDDVEITRVADNVVEQCRTQQARVRRRRSGGKPG